MKAIYDKLVEEENINRLVYRILRHYGTMDMGILSVLVGYALTQSYPDKCMKIEDALVFLTLQFRTNLSVAVAIVEAYGYAESWMVDGVTYYRAREGKK